MTHLIQNIPHLSYKVLCIMVTAGMVFYWIIEYNRNADITLVEYKFFETMGNAIHPELSICFENPFIDERLKEINSSLNSQKYLQYLRGEILGNESYQRINYDNVTVDLEEYIVGIDIQRFNGSSPMYCSNSHNCEFVKFKNIANGFISSYQFYKCFGIQLNKDYANDISIVTLIFNASFGGLLTNLGAVYGTFIYPQQFIQSLYGYRIWKNLNETVNAPFLKPEKLEILKRRNKPKEPCFLEWNEFDDFILHKHIENVGCRAPYTKRYKNFPLCNTQKQMQNSVFDMMGMNKKYPPPCQGISHLALQNVPFHIADFFGNISLRNSPILMIGYLDKMKIITQSRLIDGQSLVGYIGGYVGLFLGKI